MIAILYLICTVISSSTGSYPSEKVYPTVDLLENSPLNTLVIELEKTAQRLVLINISGFETKFFAIANGNIYTKNVIDREAFVRERYCSDKFYCKVELQILVDGGLAYWIVPIHIVDENDNKPEFAKREIELKFVENALSGYNKYFEGARDLDENENGEIRYIMDCSSDANKRTLLFLNESSINCFPLFELTVVSQPSTTQSTNFDKLALKFNPKSTLRIEKEYKVRLFAIDNGQDGQQLVNSMDILVRIEQREKNSIKFLSPEYEFIVLLNETVNRTDNAIGKVHAASNNPSDVIYYKILPNNKSNDVKINTLTGQLYFVNGSLSDESNEIELSVEAFLIMKERRLKAQTRIKIFVRSFHLLQRISIQLETLLVHNQNYIYQLSNHSNTFFIDRRVEANEYFLKISLFSHFYPNDRFILSLDNYFNIFSLVHPSSSSLNNTYLLKLNHRIFSNQIYLLNILVKHKLTQKFLPNMFIELVVIDGFNTTTAIITTSTTMIGETLTSPILPTTRTMTTTTTTTTTTTSKDMIPVTANSLQIIDKSPEFCSENRTYFVYDTANKHKIAFLKVVQSNSVTMNNYSNFTVTNFTSFNQSEILLGDCRLIISRFSNLFNKSSQHEVCSLTASNQCYNLTFIDDINLTRSSLDNDSQLRTWTLPSKPFERLMFLISLIFILSAVVLIVLICRLNGCRGCLKIQELFLYGKKYGLGNAQCLSSSFSSPPPLQLSSSNSSLTTTGVAAKASVPVHSIIVRDCRLSPFVPIKIRNVDSEPYLFNMDDFLQREPLPKSNTFTFPSTTRVITPPSSSSSSPSPTSSTASYPRRPKPMSNLGTNSTVPRTSSATSFLQETKQLLELISSNQHLDLSKLSSDV